MAEKILIVEDEQRTRDLLTNELQNAGYEVVSTARGDKAIQLTVREQPDLIILDIILEGDLDGYNVARSLNALDQTHAPYIIFLSTKKEVRDRVQGFATGAHDFISKENFSLEEFMARVKNGVRIKKTHDALLDRSNIDGLTELFNHRFFMEELQKEMGKARQHGFTLSLAFLDVDDFKMYNDLYGHYAGDRVLNGIAKIIRAKCRNTDICARYGGEEFAVILPSTNSKGAQIVMERVRAMVEEEKFPVRGTGYAMEYGSTTVSIGISTYTSGLSDREFIENSDKKALYRAKAAGKNRIYIYLGHDEDGQEIVIDAAGRKPDLIDISDLLAKINEVEAKISSLGEESILEPIIRAKKELETLTTHINKLYSDEEDPT
ncbi:diguanylate cyclase [candidate division CSSED10-310 bacterium]|uniref:Diguanylate cyclase n=1 Tax=candidate division CSSED10-310 bacterium TaxID=2855610 RepID=A0ABV6Z0E3_UNCC1